MRRNPAIRKTDEAPEVRCRLPLRDANDIVVARNNDGQYIIKLKGFNAFDFGIEIDRPDVAKRLAEAATSVCEALNREERAETSILTKPTPQARREPQKKGQVRGRGDGPKSPPPQKRSSA